MNPKTTLAILSGSALAMLYASAAMAAHPLFTDDTGTQGKGKNQVEIVHERASDEAGGVTSKANLTAVTLAHGLGDPLDVFVSLPHLTLNSPGSSESGLGDAQVGVKWRFFEQGPLSIAIKPAITLATGDETKDLGNGESGYSLFAMATLSHGDWTLNGQLGRVHEKFTGGTTANSNAISVGGWYEMDKKVRLVLDYGRTTNPAGVEDSVFLIAGAIFLLKPNTDVDLAIRKGVTDVETDKTILLGLTYRF